MPWFGRAGIGTIADATKHSPTVASNGLAVGLHAARDTENCRVVCDDHQDSRVTSKHSVNLSFGRVTACHTGLEPKTVLRGTSNQAGRAACQVIDCAASPPRLCPSASHVPKAMSRYASSSSLNHQNCRHGPLLDRLGPFFLVRSKPKLTVCRQSGLYCTCRRHASPVLPAVP